MVRQTSYGPAGLASIPPPWPVACRCLPARLAGLASVAANADMSASTAPPLHLVKLAVGVRDLPHLRAIQAERALREPPLRHRTRNMPRRAAEILAGGSMYWVIGGAIVARQRILDLVKDRWEDGTPCAGVVLEADLVPVRGRLMKPFQGWRYLQESDAPADLATGPPHGAAELPEALRHELEALCLL